MLGYNRLGINGRLGNQMFQYAALRGIAAKHNYDWVIPPLDHTTIPMAEYVLFDGFKMSSVKESNFGFIPQDRPTYDEPSHDFDVNLFNNCPDNINLDGFRQSEKYFKHIENEIRKDFEWRDDVKKMCQDMVDSIGGKAISLHIRRTDHLIKPTYHPVLPLSYYEDALSKFPSDLPVIVFSNEPEWCHKQDIFKDDRFLVSESGDNITDMCLMSMCQYQIMANSTYSWWGAWLSNSKDVIAPKLWFGPDGQDPRDVYVDRWLYLDV